MQQGGNHTRSVGKVVFMLGLGFCAGMLAHGGAVAFFKGAGHTNYTQLTNPILATRAFDESFTTADRNELESSLEAFLNEKKKLGEVSEAGIFFRDLNNGPVFGINGDVQFAPASLLKVPLAMAYYREYEDVDRGILAQQIDFTGPKGTTTDIHYPAPASVEPGRQYSIQELISYMLKYSDNEATSILSQYLAPIKVNKTYRDLGVAQVENYNLYTISVRDYAAFFRILYNATYLDQASSEALLETLSEASFDVGLVSGVPQGTPVAHKFGERVLEDGLKQLNDCGIIYAPTHPYVLCVMAQGSSFDQLAAFIEGVSTRVYAAIKQ